MKPVLYFNLEITVDSRWARFKVAAFTEAEALKTCAEYFQGRLLKILSFNQGPWTAEGFSK